MIFNDERILNIIKDAPNSHVFKIFLHIALNQPKDGIQGYRITKKQLQFDLKLGRTVFFESLHWLIKNDLIQEIKLADNSDFMASPYFVMNNSDRETRINEWNRRCRIDSLKLLAKRKRKLKAESKKLNQQ